MSDGQPVLGSLFVYAPNRVAPVVFAILYGLSATCHIWQCYRYKSFKLLGLHPLCAVVFTAGYALRELGAFNYLYTPSNLIIFLLSQVLVFICPPLLELANYRVLGRILHYVPHLSPLPPGSVSTIFGGLLAFVEALNGIGVALTANVASASGTQELGSRLTIASITLQLVVIVTFVIMAATFHWRCTKAHIRARAVSTPMITLYLSMVLIFVRCIYRLVEHLGNATVHLSDFESLKALSPILRYEWFFYVFEATLMLINSVLWNVWHPGRYMPRDSRVYLARDGITEVEDASEVHNTPLLITIGSIFTFGILGALYRKRQAKAAHVSGHGMLHRGGEVKTDREPLLIAIGSLLSCRIIGTSHRRRKVTYTVGEELDDYGSHRRLPSNV